MLTELGKKKIKGKKSLTIKRKLTYALGTIAAILLLTSVISIFEYKRMSNYISDLIAENIHNMNVSQKLLSDTDKYNLDILSLIGTADSSTIVDFRQSDYINQTDSIRANYRSINNTVLNPILKSYSEYISKSLELNKAISSDFIDAREWYFVELQPRYNYFKQSLEKYNSQVYSDLKENSLTFQEGYYRSIVPGVVSVAAGLLLVLLLLFFIIVYYLNPLNKIIFHLKNYVQAGKKYNFIFDGDDELVDLNDSITDILEENVELKRRIKNLKEDK